MRKFFFIVTAVLVGCTAQSTPPSSAAFSDEQFIGYYSTPTSDYCEANPNDRMCKELMGVSACLQLTRDADENFKMEAYAVAKGGYSCNFFGHGRRAGQHMVAQQDDPVREGGRVLIDQEGGDLVLRYEKTDPDAHGICGNHMSLDGLRFRRQDRGPVRGEATCAQR